MEEIEQFFIEYEKTLIGLVAIATLVGFAWAAIMVYVKFIKPKDIPSKATPEPTVKMTLDQFEARTQAKIDHALAERDATAPENLTLKNAQIATLRDRLANAEQSFAEQLEFVADLEKRLDREGNTAGGDALQNAKDALEAGDTKAARKFFKNIKAEKALDVDASARASFALGEIAEQDVRWKDAFEHYQEASRLKPCFDHLIHAQNMALNMADYQVAQSLGQDALDAAELEFGRNSEQYGTALNDHAVTLKSTGRFKEAEPLFRQALEITQQALGEEHPDFGTRLNNLAGLLENTGRFEEAEPLYRQALEITQRTLGEAHPSFGTRLNNLAGLLEAPAGLIRQSRCIAKPSIFWKNH